jgi:hydroxyethylthiazole kinase-like sugar kinase family protein
VVNQGVNDIESDIKIFIDSYLINKRSINNKGLVSVSIRISYKTSELNKTLYLVILDTDFKAVNFNINEIMNLILTRIESKGIDIENITSVHLHLFYN